MKVIRILAMVVCLAVPLCLTAQTPVQQAAPVAPAVTEDAIVVVECNSYYTYDMIAKQYKAWVEINYDIVNGGVIYAYIYDAKNDDWYAFPPLNGVAVAGNKRGVTTMDYFVAKGSDLEAAMIAGRVSADPITVRVKLVPNAQGATPLIDEAGIYYSE